MAKPEVTVEEIAGRILRIVGGDIGGKGTRIADEIRAAVDAQREKDADIAKAYSIKIGEAAAGLDDPKFSQMTTASMQVMFVADDIRAGGED